MSHFFDAKNLKQYLSTHGGICEGKPHETPDQELAVNAYLVDYDGNPKAKGLLGFCGENALPTCATELIQAGADMNDIYHGKSVLVHVETLCRENKHSKLTMKHLKELKTLLIQRGAKRIIQKSPIHKGIQHTR